MNKLMIAVFALSSSAAFASTTVCTGFCVTQTPQNLVRPMKREVISLLAQGENETIAVANLKAKCTSKNSALVSRLDFFGGSLTDVLLSKDSSAAVSFGIAGKDYSCVAL